MNDLVLKETRYEGIEAVVTKAMPTELSTINE
jgi:hypothetical protein